MEDSKVVLFAYHADNPSVGMSLHENISRYKMFMNDTGLFITLAFWDKAVTENVIYQKLLSDKLPADLGYVYENIVAQMLSATGNRLFIIRGSLKPPIICMRSISCSREVVNYGLWK